MRLSESNTGKINPSPDNIRYHTKPRALRDKQAKEIHRVTYGSEK